MSFLIRWLVTAIAAGVAVWIVPGVAIIGSAQTWVGVIIFALILSLVNVAIKPIAQVLSLPLTVLTLGIFYIVVNTLMIYLAAWLSDSIFAIGFHIQSFGSAFLASIIISIVSALVNALIGNDRRYTTNY